MAQLHTLLGGKWHERTDIAKKQKVDHLHCCQALLSVALLDADMHIIFAVVVVCLSVCKRICDSIGCISAG